MSPILSFICRQPWAVLAVILGVTAVAAVQLVDPRTGEVRLTIDPSPNRFLPEADEAKKFYDFVRRAFGSDETMLVVLGTEDIFTPENLARIRRITRRIANVDGVHHVVSITNAQYIRGFGDELEIAPFVSTLPANAEAAAKLREEALSNPLFVGNLISADARTTALLVYFLDFSDTEFLRRGIDDAILRITEEERGETQIWLTGTPHLKVAQIRMLRRDLLQRSLPLILLVGALVLAVSFRTVRGVLLPLLTVMLALVWTMGFAAWLGEPLNLITVLVPPLLMILGITYSVHVVSEYYDALKKRDREPDGAGSPTSVGGEPNSGPAFAALSHVWLPVALTGLTTAAGFLALVLSPITPIREFGVLSLVGVIFTVIASLTFAPALLQILGEPRSRAARGADDLFDRFVEKVAEFDLKRRKGIFIASGVMTVVALALIPRIEIGTKHIEAFPADAPVRRDFEAINERMDGAGAFNVVLEASYVGAWKEPENLARLEALQSWLEAQPEIGGTTSIVDYLKVINRGFHGGHPEQLRIPDSRRLVGQLLFFGASDEIESFIDSRHRIANVLVRSSVVDSNQVLKLTHRIEARLAELPEHLKGTVTGNPILINRMLDDLVHGQVISMIGSVGLIYVILSFLFVSARIGAIALIPNVIPIAVFFGALGATGIMLSPGTSLIAPMALGVAIDDTIHYFARFNRDAKRFANERLGTISALRAVGRPVTYTSIAICLGFLVFTTNELQTQVEIGLLGAFTLAIAWLVDFLLTPALCSGLRVVTIWDTLSLDLGDSPETSIPLFHGLSKAQARIVALMASIRRVPGGRRLVSEGDTGEDMFVIIDGRLQVTIEREQKRIDLGTNTRGDVIGEVALFGGHRRSADVDVVEDARLLRLTPNNLARLSRRYPRIAAQVFRNLNKVLAERLIRTTTRLRD